MSTRVKVDDEHAFHISRTTLNYDSPSKSYQLTIHIFVDDLTTCLEKKGYKNLNIGSKSESPKTDDAIEAYLKEKINISQSPALPLTFVGREFSEDGIALYCYLESGKVAYDPHIKVKNALLLESFSDQKNIIDVTKDKKRVGQMLCTIGSEWQQM